MPTKAIQLMHEVKAYNNALNKTNSNSQAALERRYTASYVSMLRKSSDLKDQALARKIIKALKNSMNKRGLESAMLRRQEVAALRSARAMDEKRQWGRSYFADLKHLDKFYYPLRLTKEITKYLEQTGSRSAVVVEIGAGVGNAASELKDAFGNRIKVIATGTKQEKRWAEQLNADKIDWRVAHAGNMKRVYPSGQVDIIHSNLGFCHARDKAKALSEAHRLLKRGGLLLFTAEKRQIPQNTHPTGFEVLVNTRTIHELPVQKGDSSPQGELFVYLLRKL
jgi:SAM-dependent methyltransferase